jgi:peptidoglycan hydrolase-like protein with peptidoglycan-binding domain
MSGLACRARGSGVFGMGRFGGKKAGKPGAASGGPGAASGRSMTGAGSSATGRRRRGRHAAQVRGRTRAIALAAAIAAVTVAGGAYALTHGASGGQPAAASVQGAALAGQATTTKPLRVTATSPAAGARGIDGGNPVVVTFSAPLAAGSPMPALTPAVQGRWQQAGRALTFRPAVPFSPASHVTLRIPAGQAGVRTSAGGLLTRPVVTRFQTRSWSTRRLSELLGQLGYLPLSWNPLGDGAGRPNAGPGAEAGTAASGPTGQIAAAYSPPPGKFRWHHGYPASLHSRWHAGRPNPILKGAVMAFQAQHGMKLTGIAGARVWSALFSAAEHGHSNRAGYTYALASKGSPETLTIWHDGHIVLRSAANTGIPVAPTADGTFPVYLRYRFQIMRGTNPDGSSYADPVEFVSYFDGGEAVHYFPRGSYGSPQSLGCVELPITAAARAWPYLTYGSLVTVAG